MDTNGILEIYSYLMKKKKKKNDIRKCLDILKFFFNILGVCTIVNFSESLASNYRGPMKYIYLNKQSYQARPTFVNINSDEATFYSFTVSVNKCGGNYNIIDDPYGQVCVPNKVESMNLKVFNLMLLVNKTRSMVQHESCKCRCELNQSVCNSNQKIES